MEGSSSETAVHFSALEESTTFCAKHSTHSRNPSTNSRSNTYQGLQSKRYCLQLQCRGAEDCFHDHSTEVIPICLFSSLPWRFTLGWPAKPGCWLHGPSMWPKAAVLTLGTLGKKPCNIAHTSHTKKLGEKPNCKKNIKLKPPLPEYTSYQNPETLFHKKCGFITFSVQRYVL